MTAAYFTFDGDDGEGVAPHRPSTADLGYDDLEDLAGNPPNPRTHPTSAAWNQRTKNAAALSRMADMLKITVKFSGGVPAVTNAAFAGTLLEIADFTVVDNGVGDTTVTWPANSIPPSMVDPHGLTLNTAMGAGFAAAVTNGVQVTTQNLAGSATDIGWTVCIG